MLKLTKGGFGLENDFDKIVYEEFTEMLPERIKSHKVKLRDAHIAKFFVSKINNFVCLKKKKDHSKRTVLEWIISDLRDENYEKVLTALNRINTKKDYKVTNEKKTRINIDKNTETHRKYTKLLKNIIAKVEDHIK